MAPLLQAAKQSPHLMHRSLSMRWVFFSSPEIASCGQAFLHSRHPTHLSETT